MTDTTQTKKDEKTVANDMADRTIFATLADAQTFLDASATRYADWDRQTFAAPKVSEDEEGNAVFDPEAWAAPGMEIMVARLKNKGKAGQASTMKAIVLAPIPTLEALLADEAGRKFVQAIIHKELNHRAVRALREAEDVTSVADQIPTTLAGYISSSRDVGGIIEAFNELYKSINATLSKARPQWAKARLTKQELRKAMESKGYALEYYSPLEESGKDGSLFVAAINLGMNAAKRQGLDPTIFERWLANRDSKVFDADDEAEDEEELNLEALTDAMLTEPAKPAESTGEELAPEGSEQTHGDEDGQPDAA